MLAESNSGTLFTDGRGGSSSHHVWLFPKCWVKNLPNQKKRLDPCQPYSLDCSITSVQLQRTRYHHFLRFHGLSSQGFHLEILDSKLLVNLNVPSPSPTVFYTLRNNNLMLPVLYCTCIFLASLDCDCDLSMPFNLSEPFGPFSHSQTSRTFIHSLYYT